MIWVWVTWLAESATSELQRLLFLLERPGLLTMVQNLPNKRPRPMAWRPSMACRPVKKMSCHLPNSVIPYHRTQAWAKMSYNSLALGKSTSFIAWGEK